MLFSKSILKGLAYGYMELELIEEGFMEYPSFIGWIVCFEAKIHSDRPERGIISESEAGSHSNLINPGGFISVPRIAEIQEEGSAEIAKETVSRFNRTFKQKRSAYDCRVVEYFQEVLISQIFD